MLGEGKMWSPKTGWAEAAEVLRENHLEPLELGPKEGLALINGTQMVTSIGALGKQYSLFFVQSLFSLDPRRKYFKTSRRHCRADT
jgi:histidine ammonia-lyase